MSSRRINFPILLTSFCALVGVSNGCAALKKAPAHESAVTNPGKNSLRTTVLSQRMGPEEIFGPSLSLSGSSLEPVDSSSMHVSQLIQTRPLVLVFSPGIVKGFAHSGVIEALVSSKVSIGAVLGAEMGALIGAIYASNTNVNRLQWELMKFKEDVFQSERGLFSRHKLESELKRLFGHKDIRETKIPYVVAFQQERSGVLELVNQGPAQDAVRSAIAFPEMLNPGQWNGSATISAQKSLPALIAMIHEAKSLQIGPVVVIDVNEDRSLEREQAFEEADLVIRPDLRGIQDLDFKKRSDATFRGKKAVIDHLREIYFWAGMPETDR